VALQAKQQTLKDDNWQEQERSKCHDDPITDTLSDVQAKPVAQIET
jgi:hypothetical protein